MTESDDSQVYRVVLNDEEQYSIWFSERENPQGWRDAGFSGSKAECLAHIDKIWTDMRPLSVRQHLEQLGMKSHVTPSSE
jgi:MbtH protein